MLTWALGQKGSLIALAASSTDRFWPSPGGRVAECCINCSMEGGRQSSLGRSASDPTSCRWHSTTGARIHQGNRQGRGEQLGV